MPRTKSKPTGGLPPSQPQSKEKTTGYAPHTHEGLERIIFFSDAVIAIAITLLALEIKLPDADFSSGELGSHLLKLTPHFLSFFISFFVIALFWMSHHRIFEYIRTYDNGLIWINFLFLFLIAFIPFPTAVLGRFGAQFLSVTFYAGVVTALSLVRILFWWYVYYKAKLVNADTDPRAGRFEFMRAVWTAAIFAASIVIAIFNPTWAMFFWMMLLPATILIRSK